MSITAETAREHAKDPAVLCCRAEGGLILEASNLEDPAIFPDLEDSGLLSIPENCLKIGDVLGKKLLKTTDALVPLTPDMLDGVVANQEEVESTEEDEVSQPVVEKPIESEPVSVQNFNSSVNSQFISIHIAEGKGIDLQIPLTTVASAPQTQNVQSQVATQENVVAADHAPDQVQHSEAGEAKKVRGFVRKHFKIEKVEFGSETKIEGTTLTIREPKEICQEAVDGQELVKSLELEIINPKDYGQYSETIMDVQPIATKEEGDIGHGITRILDGVVFVLTGTDENGVQIGEFGSSEGELEKNIMWGRPGAPDKGEILIKAEVVIKAGTNMERRGPLAAHKAADHVVEEIRKVMKELDESLVVDSQEIVQLRRKGQKRLLVVKEIMGQGAMHDNLIMPVEPVGTLGAKPNVDLGNVPVVLAPTEVLDGGIHALTCIGPASKETSRHYYREPLVLEALQDEDVDLVGVVLVGSPQANSDKFYVSKRLGMMVEAMDVDGAIVTTEGFGNNHVDFASHIDEIGRRGIPVVGVSFCAVQGALVVGNEHMGAMVDNNKSMQGIENEILCNNTLCPEDAKRAMAMVKTLMNGGEVKKPERKWNPSVKENNVEIIEKTDGVKLDLVDNEQILPKSKKRLEIYEKE